MIHGHGDTTQQHAAEFVGWLRGQVFGNGLEGQFLARLQKCFLHRYGPGTFAFAEPSPAKGALQDLIDEWHLSNPYIYALLQSKNIQKDRFPSLNYKFCESILWSCAQVLLLVFRMAINYRRACALWLKVLWPRTCG